MKSSFTHPDLIWNAFAEIDNINLTQIKSETSAPRKKFEEALSANIDRYKPPPRPLPKKSFVVNNDGSNLL
jgi:hypothetical protein